MSDAFNADGAELERLIDAARNGSDEALGRLLDGCRDYLLLIANQEVAADLRPKVGASDLVQETFLEAGRVFAQFRGRRREDLLAWLSTILRNNLANVRRSFRATDKRRLDREVALTDTPRGRQPEGLVDPGETPSDRLECQERDAALERAIDRLPEDYRRVIRWRKDDGCSYEEMGRRLGRSAEAARKLHTRAVEYLAQLLEPRHDSD